MWACIHGCAHVCGHVSVDNIRSRLQIIFHLSIVPLLVKVKVKDVVVVVDFRRMTCELNSIQWRMAWELTSSSVYHGST